ncbi:phage tail tape measure protein [uncultured Helicobacter sp.]|uniref:phage tail tape measure protein n=1 Tax=uncultured Helicobacter sp. TaxID=175537 RepID=UPI00262D3DCE|nr:phage tail tape measure protein [uncultured Helicobacter sp.]
MQTQISLKLIPELSQLSKAIDKITKDTSEGLSKAINAPLDKLKDKFKIESNIGKTLQGPKLPTQSIKEMQTKLKEAMRVKLDLDLSAANAKIDSMRYQILGTYATFKGMVSKPISVAMEFESSMADVKKVVDFASKEELKGFEKEIWELTKTIPLAAKDLTAIVASGGQLGLEKNILIPFTDVVAKMSTAFDMNTSEAGDTIAGLMKKMGIGIDEVKELGDAINYIGAKSAGSPREVVAILGRIGGMAKTIGLSSEQTAGLAGAFANMKIPADQAGTAINKMLSVLGNADGGTARFQSALEKIGLSGEELKEIMNDNPLQGLTQVLKSIGNVEQSEKIGILKNMFGEEAGPKIAQITENMGEFDKILALVANKENYLGSMQKEFDEVSNTTANAIQLMQNSFTRIANAVGSVFLPPLASAIKSIASVSSKIAIWLERFPAITMAIGAIVGSLFALKIAFIAVKSASALWTLFTYPLTKSLIALRFTTIGNTLSLARHRIALIYSTIATKAYTLATFGANLTTKAWGISTALFAKVFKVSMWSVKGALISTGIGALIVGIGLAISYVLENWESIAPKLVAVWEWIKEAISPVVQWFEGIFGFIAKGIDKILSGARAVTDFLGITDSEDSMSSINTQGLVDSTLATQTQNAQSFYNSTQSRQINDNKTIYITTSANANDVAKAITDYSYSYAD